MANTKSTHQHAASASALLSCLRYGGLGDDDIRDGLAVGDPRFVADWADKFRRRRSPDARQAAHYLDDVIHDDDTELQHAMALLTMALDPAGVVAGFSHLAADIDPPIVGRR